MSIWIRLWQRAFVRQIRKQGGPAVTVCEVRRERARLPAYQMPGTDAAATRNRALAETLLAATLCLEQGHGLARPQAVAVAQGAFLATGTGFARWVMRVWLLVERDPMAGLRRRGLAGNAARLWGDGMRLSDHDSGDSFELHVSACPFAEYFWNAGRGDLTPVLCAWDGAWMDSVNRHRRAIKVDRPGTLAEGHARCAFRFRVSPPLRSPAPRRCLLRDTS